VDVLLGALNTRLEFANLHVLFCRFLNKAREMVGVRALGVDSERHDLDLHDNLVGTDATLLSSLEGTCNLNSSTLSFVNFQESLNDIFF
jgi:hypothetical protein